MPLEPRASWFSPKCVEAQQLTGHLGGSRSASETMGDKLHRREGNSPDHQLRPLNDRSVIKEVGVQRQPGVQKDFIQPKFRMELSLIDGWDCLQQSVYIARALETISYRIGTRPKAQPKEKLSQSKEKLNENLTLRRLLAGVVSKFRFILCL
ncbi:UNVERIFIED_CONTAM: hypothetical protein Sradi_6976800 [Sesamum radiatum]|uniref:Uncharacterized protein n=2 Tax=Sesamum TaxID=4181 RepID=A0AAW2SHP1_9LAMI